MRQMGGGVDQYGRKGYGWDGWKYYGAADSLVEEHYGDDQWGRWMLVTEVVVAVRNGRQG